MKSMRVLSVACLGLAAALMTGCDEKYTLKIMNATSEVQRIQIVDSQGFPEHEFSVTPDGGKQACTIKQDENAVESYTLKSNSFSQTFTISKKSPNPMFFHITPKEIIGPVDEHAKVSAKWDDTTPVRQTTKEKVE
jgi:hypothetical protein